MSINYLHNIFSLGNIRRFSNKQTLCDRDVAKHLFSVATMAMIIGDEENLRKRRTRKLNMEMVIRKAVLHDFPEGMTGDVLYPLKHFNEAINREINAVEALLVDSELLKEFDPKLKKKYFNYMINCKVGEEGKLVAICDLLDILYHCVLERSLGNNSRWVDDVFESTVKLLSPKLEEFPCARKYFDYMRNAFSNPSLVATGV